MSRVNVVRFKPRLSVLLPGFFFSGLAVCVAISGCAERHWRDSTPAQKAHAVILMIGDGMGDSEITAARNYWVGAAGRLAMDRLPVTGNITTYAVQEGEPHLP